MTDERRTGRIVPVILAGGSGTRLWPLSRSLCPKQFLPLLKTDSLLVETCRRVSDASRFAPPIVICNNRHQSLLTQQLRDASIRPETIILEPLARGTAAAAAIAATFVARTNADDLLLLLAADNHIQDSEAFLAAVEAGASAAAVGRIVVFGVTPRRVETGYGYIKVGSSIGDVAQGVETFVEKPDFQRAEGFISSGQYLWNSGNFLFTARTAIREFERLQPAIVESCAQALDRAVAKSGSLLLDEASLADSPSESLDRAIMERTDLAAVVPMDAGWSDVGTWEALWLASSRDVDGNSLIGDAIVSDSKGSYIRSEQRLVVAIGVNDLVVVETGDAVFVAPRDRAAEAKATVERLERLQRPEARAHAQVAEDWGSVRKIDETGDASVARLVVNPNCQLMRQVDSNRAEHWIVIQGKVCIVRAGERLYLHAGESIHIAAGTSYTLANAAEMPLHLIQVQTIAAARNDVHRQGLHMERYEWPLQPVLMK